jgi:hypothetical protein
MGRARLGPIGGRSGRAAAGEARPG